MKLGFAAFEKALKSFEIAIHRSLREPTDKEVRDAVIQRFKYSFEIAFKFLRRVLEIESSSPQAIDQMSFKEVLREAGEKGLIAQFENWVVFRDQRKITSHTYNEKKAESVYKAAIDFLPEAQRLLASLKSRARD